MGGALALLAAVTVPERISSLVLFAPAGLPLTKPLRDSARDCGAQLRRGLYRRADVLNGLKQFARAPAAAVRLAAAVRSLELTAELEIVRGHGIPVKVVSCTTDTLVTVGHCRRIAELLAAAHRELPLAGGHMWMLRDWPAFSAELE
jgi:pimeloyl-ACP methyl ester carboxylesterase